MKSYRTFFESTQTETPGSRNKIYKTLSTPLFEKRHRRKLSSTRSASRFSSPSPSSFLNKIKNRHLHQDTPVTPELASQVIRDFLLPMFEADGRNIAAKSRSSLFGVNSKENSLRIVKGKLSEIILKQLNITNEELEKLKNRWVDAEQEKKRIKNEIEELKGNLINSICNLNMLKYQIQETNKNIKAEQLNASMINQQINEYRQMNLKREVERIENIDQLNKERIKNKILGDKANELQHWNALFLMQNDIMGERLKGLYEACEDVCDNERADEKIDNEFQIIKKRSSDLFSYWTNTEENTLQVSQNCLEFINQNHEASLKRKQYRDDVKKLKYTMKDILLTMTKKVSQATDEKNNYEEKCTQMEKKFKDINESYAKVRLQIKDMNAKRKQFGLDEEKLCRNCNKAFYEKDNYNWSCLRHAGKWNGTMYWCCGKLKEEAIGCVKSKHESRDDEEGDENEANDEITNKKLNKKCPSCKEIGHLPHQCPKDPNARSNVSQKEEIDRIFLTQRRRDRIGNFNNDVTIKLKAMLKINEEDEKEGKTQRENMGFEDIEEVRLEAIETPINIFDIAKKTLDKSSSSAKHRKFSRMNSMSKDFTGLLDSGLLLSSKNNEGSHSRRQSINFKLSPIDT